MGYILHRTRNDSLISYGLADCIKPLLDSSAPLHDASRLPFGETSHQNCTIIQSSGRKSMKLCAGFSSTAAQCQAFTCTPMGVPLWVQLHPVA